jgi:large-conductance mechanosensitive channel
LQSEQTKLLELMEQAEDLSDVISIETRLSEVESQLKQAQTQMAVMDQDIAYSSVSINIEEVSEYQDLQIDQFSVRIKNALLNTWTNFIAVMQNICISLIYALPFLIVALIVILLAVWIIHKHKKHKKSKAKNLKSKDAQESAND